MRSSETSTSRRSQPEFELQKAVAEYLRLRYPSVMFLSDVRAALKLTMPQANRSKLIQAAEFSCPDMVIFASRGGYSGMFLELKAETPYRKDGALKSSPHLWAQHDAIERLRCEGYHAGFYWNFDDVRKNLDWYLKG